MSAEERRALRRARLRNRPTGASPPPDPAGPTTAQWLRRAVGRVYDGSVHLALHSMSRGFTRARDRVRRVAGWVGRADGFDKLIRIGLLALLVLLVRKVATAIGGWAYQRIAAGAWGLPLSLAAAAWIVAAYLAGRPGWTPKPPKQKPAETTGEGQPEDADSTPAVVLAKPPPVSPVALVAAVRDIGTPHAQLKPLAEHLGTTTDAVRATAAGIGWPVKDVRMEGRSSSAGLRWDDCPSPTILAPSSGVVGAGQAADDNDDDSGRGIREKGLRVEPIGLSGTVVRDPADDVRHHTVRDQ